MSEFMPTILAALLLTYLLSGVFLRLLRIFLAGLPAVLAAHLAALGVALLLSEWAGADDEPFKWTVASIYMLSQMIWLAMDFIRRSKPTSTVQFFNTGE